MTISQFKESLKSINHVQFITPDGSEVPPHFHITEAGLTTKHFLDCGGNERREHSVSMQLWSATDYDHRLTPKTLQIILAKIDPIVGEHDPEVEIEYQTDTIGRYGVEFNGSAFQLTRKFTDCPDKSACETEGVSLSEPEACTTPGCC